MASDHEQQERTDEAISQISDDKDQQSGKDKEKDQSLTTTIEDV